MNENELEQVFITEARKGLDEIKALLVQVSRNPDDESLWHRLRRTLANLGADAQGAGKGELAQVASAMNRIPEGLAEGRFVLSVSYVKLLNLVFEYLEAALETDDDPSLGGVSLKPVCDLCERAYNRESFVLKGFSLTEMKHKRKETAQKSTVESNNEETVNIGIQAMERLGKQLNSVIVHQFQLKKNGDVLQNLETEVRELVQNLKEGESASRVLQRAESVLKDLKTVTTGFKEDLVVVDRSSFALQEEIARLRMLPFQTICKKLEDYAQSLANQSGKKLALHLDGVDTLLDKTILDLVLLPLTELLANAVIHGIADNSSGTVSLSCSSDGSTIHINVVDKGPGIDYEGIRTAALGLFPLEREEILVMNTVQLTRFLFEPGIQVNKQENSLVSGEGKGLSIVKDALDAMQGRVSVNSDGQTGSTVMLQIPASVSLVSGFFIRSGGERFFISAVYVREIVIFNRKELVILPGGPAYPLRQEMIPVVPLSSVFKGKETLHKDVEQMAVISLMGETWGLILDTIVRHATLGYKQLPDNLSSLKEVQGLVYDEKFNLVPILNIPVIIGHIRRLRSIEFRRRYQKEDLDCRNILLVDDSLVSRQTLSRILSEGGFTVEVAEDGIAALDLLHRKYFHLVISDDDMPRMDGLTLVENLRKEPEYANVPVMIMIAERNGDLEARFRSVGIRDFYRKADFDRQALLYDIHRLLVEE